MKVILCEIEAPYTYPVVNSMHGWYMYHCRKTSNEYNSKNTIMVYPGLPRDMQYIAKFFIHVYRDIFLVISRFTNEHARGIYGDRRKLRR